MGKKVTSTIKRFPGSVTFYEPLTFPMVIAFEESIAQAKALEGARQSQFDAVLLPAIFACVEEWNLEGVGDLTPETFPGSPRKASAELVAWLAGEILSLYTEEEEAPNA